MLCHVSGRWRHTIRGAVQAGASLFWRRKQNMFATDVLKIISPFLIRISDSSMALKVNSTRIWCTTINSIVGHIPYVPCAVFVLRVQEACKREFLLQSARMWFCQIDYCWQYSKQSTPLRFASQNYSMWKNSFSKDMNSSFCTRWLDLLMRAVTDHTAIELFALLVASVSSHASRSSHHA